MKTTRNRVMRTVAIATAPVLLFGAAACGESEPNHSAMANKQPTLEATQRGNATLYLRAGNTCLGLTYGEETKEDVGTGPCPPK